MLGWILGVIGLLSVPLLVYLAAKALCSPSASADAHIDYVDAADAAELRKQ